MPTYPIYDGRMPLTRAAMSDLTAQAQAGTRRGAGTGLVMNDMGSLGVSHAPDRTRMGVGIWAVLTDSQEYVTSYQGVNASVVAWSWKEIIRRPNGTWEEHLHPLSGEQFREPAVERLNRPASLLEPVFLRRRVIDLSQLDNPFPTWLVDRFNPGPVLPVCWTFDANFRWEWAKVTNVVLPALFSPGSFDWHQVTVPGGDDVPDGDHGPPVNIVALDAGPRQEDIYLVRDWKFRTGLTSRVRISQFGRNYTGTSSGTPGFNTVPAGDPFYDAHPGVDLRFGRISQGGIISITDVTVGASAVLDLSTAPAGAFPVNVVLNLNWGNGAFQENLLLDTRTVFAPRQIRLGGVAHLMALPTLSGWEILAPWASPPPGTTWINPSTGLTVIVPSTTGTFWMKYSYNASS